MRAAGRSSPPPAGTTRSESVTRPSIRIRPFEPQLRSAPPGAGQTITGEPPATGTRSITPPATNAISRLSGDQ